MTSLAFLSFIAYITKHTFTFSLPTEECKTKKHKLINQSIYLVQRFHADESYGNEATEA